MNILSETIMKDSKLQSFQKKVIQVHNIYC